MTDTGGKAPQRVFVVGCVRSGTTLLQSFLGGHPEILTFPESHFVGHIVGDHMERAFDIQPEGPQAHIWSALKRGRIALGIANRSVMPRFRENLAHIDRMDLLAVMPRHPIGIRTAIRKWSQALDRAAIDQGRTIWLDKTPMHYAYIHEISDCVENAKFVHVVRDGRAVMASMKDAAQRFPETGWSRYNDVVQCVRVWNRAIEFTRQYKDHPEHAIVFYDELVANPKHVLAAICRFLSIEFDEKMLVSRADVAGQISLLQEPWKARVAGEMKSIDKANVIFSREELLYVDSSMTNVDDIRAARIQRCPP